MVGFRAAQEVSPCYGLSELIGAWTFSTQHLDHEPEFGVFSLYHRTRRHETVWRSGWRWLASLSIHGEFAGKLLWLTPSTLMLPHKISWKHYVSIWFLKFAY